MIFITTNHQSNRVLTTISEQSQLLSPSKLLALERQTTLSVSQPRLGSSSGITSPIQFNPRSSIDSDLERNAIMANNALVPGISVRRGLFFDSSRSFGCPSSPASFFTLHCLPRISVYAACMLLQLQQLRAVGEKGGRGYEFLFRLVYSNAIFECKVFAIGM